MREDRGKGGSCESHTSIWLAGIQSLSATKWYEAKSPAARSCSMTDFKKLEVWQKAHVMALAARDLKAVRPSDSLTLISQVIEIRKMLYGLLRYLASRVEEGGGVTPKAASHA